MTTIMFGEYSIPPLSESTTASYSAFHWKQLRQAGWDVRFVDSAVADESPEKREYEDLAESADDTTVDDDFVAIVEKIIAHRV